MKSRYAPSPELPKPDKLRRHIRIPFELGRLAGQPSDFEHFLDQAVVQVARAVEVELSIDRAVPLGLIVNEAITNSVKHAFGDAGGRISLQLQGGIGYGEARLVVRDNGKGMQGQRPGGMGLTLIESLARQIGGQSEQHSSDRGVETIVTFPVIS